MKTALLSSLAILALAGNCVFGVPANAPARPNIVFILIDDMGWADSGCFGGKFYQTPQIDALAASGVRFTSAYAACAVCSPTRAALMTGKYPARLHITDYIPGEGTPKNSRFTLPDWTEHLPLEETTLATALKKLGYPNRLGIHGALSPKSKIGLSDQEVTLAQLLKARGYASRIGFMTGGHAARWKDETKADVLTAKAIGQKMNFE